MCGIAGHIGHPGTEPAEIARILHSLRHRGPDDQGIYLKEEAWLGHRRLSIIDLETGRQPIHNEDLTIWIVCNGEIYNFQSLRKELQHRGHQFETRSDTEVIVHLYEEMGTDCVQKLRGMFAFALWDETKKRLFAARDRLGQKPFYYSRTGSQFLFASEPRGILAMDPIGRQMDPQALIQYLTLRVISPPLSMFHGISKLPPASFLTFNQQHGLHITPYWELQYEPKWRDNDADLLQELEQRLIECVRLHMVSDVEVGAFLSGGLDSTLVTALSMKHVAANPMPTFTIGIPYGNFDEAPAAKSVALRYGTRHHEQTFVPSLVENLPRLMSHLDEPADPLALCMFLLSEMASRHVKVVLGGDGGDELFGGYDRYYGNLYAGRYALLPAALRRLLIGPLVRALPDGNWYKSGSHQLKWLHHASFLSGGDRYAQSLGYFYFQPPLHKQLFGPELCAPARTFNPFLPFVRLYDQAAASHPIDRMLWVDSQLRLPDHAVMILDRTSMAHGLEARSPFMDHQLAEFAARLPIHLKVKGRNLRRIQRRLCGRYLPEAVLSRQKQGFNSPLPYLLKEEFRFLFECFLSTSELARHGFLQHSFIQTLLQEHLQGLADHGNRLWLLLNSETWFRMHIQGETPENMSETIERSLASTRQGKSPTHSPGKAEHGKYRMTGTGSRVAR